VSKLHSIIGGMSQGNLTDLVGDYRVLELLAALESRTTLSSSQRAEIIIQLYGAESLLKSREQRNSLFLALSGGERDNLAQHLKVDSDKLENLRLSAPRLESLCNYFGVEYQPPEDVDHDSFFVSEVVPTYGLFKHQNKALHKCKSVLESEEQSAVMLHMPTGSGKTRTAMHLICRHLNNSEEKKVVLWLVHGRELCNQAANEFNSAWTILGGRPLKVGRVFQDFNEITIVDDGLLVAGLSKLWILISRELAPGEVSRLASKISLIVFDEAHQSVAYTYRTMIDTLMGYNSTINLLGLSATPGRSHLGEDHDQDEGLISLFGGNKVRLDVKGYDSPIDYLQSEGYLAKVEYHEIEYPGQGMSPESRAMLNQQLSETFQIPGEMLSDLGLDAQRNLAIVQAVRNLIEGRNHKRILLFAPSVENANLLASIFVAQGTKSASITSQTPSEARDVYLDEYLDTKSDEPMVLCNYGVLTTGFDAPKTSAVVIARPTTSVVLYSQMVGRAIRGPRVKGTEFAEVWTVMDTSIEVFCDIARQFSNWDDQWRERE